MGQHKRFGLPSRYGIPIVAVMGSLLLFVFLSWLVWRGGLPDQLLFLGIVPVLLIAYYLPRWVYLLAHLSLLACALTVVWHVSESVDDSVRTVLGAYIAILLVSEIIHRLAWGQRLAAEALRVSEEYHRDLIENLLEGIAVLDANNVILFANPALESLLGVPLASLTGRNLGDFIPADELSALLEESGGRSTARRAVHLIEITRRDGERRRLSTIVAPRFDKGGRYQGGFVSLRDVTELEQANKALTRQAQEQSALISALPDLVFRISKDGVFVAYSASDLSRLLLAPEDFLNRNVVDTLPPHVAQLTLNAIEVALRSGQLATYEFQIHPGEDHHYYECRVAPLSDDEVLAIVRDITERKRSESKLTYSAQQMAALYERSLEINAYLDLPDLLQAVARQAASLVGAPMGGVYLAQAEEKKLNLAAVYNLPRSHLNREFAWGEGVAGRAAQSGQPLNIPDCRQWEGQIKLYTEGPCQRMLAVPMNVGNRVIGVIEIADDQQVGLFPDDDVRLVGLFANQAAIAIENARLFTETARRAEQLSTLNRIGLAIVSGLDMERVLETIYQQCQQIVPIQAFYVALYDAKSGMLSFPIFYDQGAALQVPPCHIDTEPGITGYIIQTGRSLYVPDLLNPNIELPFSIVQIGEQHSRSFLGIPLMLRETVIGMLSVQSYQVNAYSPDAIRLLETVAAQATIAIENARLYGELQKQAAEVAALYRASSRLLAPSGDIVSLARQIAAAVKDELGFVNCGVLLLNDKRQALERVARYGDYEIDSPLVLPLNGPGLAVEAAVTGCTVYAPDVRQAKHYIPSHPDTVSELDIPLFARGQLIGVLDLQSPQPDAFDERARRMAAAFAERAGLALENSRLYTELQRQAIVDELTGLYNYRGLLELGLREFVRARRLDRALSAFFFDIDHFRDFNNRYSHAVGNIVLQAVARRTRATMRVIDLVARFGGEEFVVLLPETRKDAAILVAERLRQEIEALHVPTEVGELGVTISIGVAEVTADMPDLAALIDAANQAEHQAKEQGRNRVVAAAD